MFHLRCCSRRRSASVHEPMSFLSLRLKRFHSPAFISSALGRSAETWYTDNKADKDSSLKIYNYNLVHQKGADNHKRGGIVVITYDKFKILKDLNNSNSSIKNLSIEILQDHSKSILVSVVFRLPKRNTTEFIKYILTTLQPHSRLSKNMSFQKYNFSICYNYSTYTCFPFFINETVIDHMKTNIHTILDELPPIEDEFKDAFVTLTEVKVLIISVQMLMHSFNFSLNSVVFSDKLQIA